MNLDCLVNRWIIQESHKKSVDLNKQKRKISQKKLQYYKIKKNIILKKWTTINLDQIS
jgi:hypothetical protein